jgi:uncharacterized glyoxalase superfamily protein PhnB
MSFHGRVLSTCLAIGLAGLTPVGGETLSPISARRHGPVTDTSTAAAIAASAALTPVATVGAVRRLTPVLIVDAIEPSLPFWTERLGFTKTVEVPHGGRLGFVILVKDGVEVMYQTWASIEADVPGVAAPERGHSTALFVEVSDVGAVERAMHGVEVVVPRRTTFYGMDEIGVREPGGHSIIFAQPTGEKPEGGA